MTRKEALERLSGGFGFASIRAMLESTAMDAVSPGICLKCGYTTEIEPDSDNGYCESCGANAVHSALILAGVI